MSNGLKVTLVVVCVVLLLGVTNGLQYYLNSNKIDAINEDAAAAVAEAQSALDALGNLVDVYFISNPNGVSPQQRVRQEDLQVERYHINTIPKNAITNINDLNLTYYRMHLSQGAVLTRDMITHEPFNNSTRQEVLRLDAYPPGMKIGDLIDVIMLYPQGEEFLVMDKVRVKDILGETIIVWANSTERYLMQGMRIDSALAGSYGARTFARLYIDSGIQTRPTRFYVPPVNIISMMAQDPNLDSHVDMSAMLAGRAFQEQLLTFDDTLSSILAAVGDGVVANFQEAHAAFLNKYGEVIASGEGVISDVTNPNENLGIADDQAFPPTGENIVIEGNEGLVIGASENPDLLANNIPYDGIAIEPELPDEWETGGEPLE